MTEQESKALETIMSNVTNVELLDSEFEVIRTGLEGRDTFESKYNELREKYIARFREETKPSLPAPVETESNETVDVEVKVYDASELEWDASTE